MGLSEIPSYLSVLFIRVKCYCSDLHEADRNFVQRQREGLRLDRLATLVMEELVLKV